MKKAKKSRVESVSIRFIEGLHDTYIETIPVDKKGRVIPSSVECVFSNRYYKVLEAAQMLRTL